MTVQADNIDTLFLNTLKDLQTKIESKDSYEILMATALLRKLLADENPLIDQVNRNRRLKVSFTINDRPAPTTEMGLVYWSVQDGFDPDTSIARLPHPITVNKDAMLKRPSMLIEGKVITVLDLIKFLSHVQGAVHAGDPKDEKQEVLKRAEEIVTVGGLPGALRSICAIGRVVLKGLEPLKQEVLKTKEEKLNK